MADQGNSKEVYYFSGGLRCMVLQECHILLTRKLENSRDNNKQSPESCDSLRFKLSLLRFQNRSGQSCYTLKVLGEKTSRESWRCHSRTATTLLLHSFICIIILEKRNDYNSEADSFPRIFWVSCHSKRQ